MTIRMLTAAAAFTCLSTAALATPLGVWATEANDAGEYLTVEVKPCGDKVCGFIVGAHGANGETDPEYANLGRQMIFDMVPDGANKWDDGEIWAPDADETYNSNMELKGDTLTVEGCVLFICRGQDWTRVN